MLGRRGRFWLATMPASATLFPASATSAAPLAKATFSTIRPPTFSFCAFICVRFRTNRSSEWLRSTVGRNARSQITETVPELGEARVNSTSTARRSPRRFRSRRTPPPPLGGQRRTGCTQDGAGLNQWRGPHPRHANRGWAQPSPTDKEELSTGASTLQNNFLSRRATRFGGVVALGPTRKHSSPEKSLQPLQIHTKNHWIPISDGPAALQPERCRQALFTSH